MKALDLKNTYFWPFDIVDEHGCFITENTKITFPDNYKVVKLRKGLLVTTDKKDYYPNYEYEVEN